MSIYADLQKVAKSVLNEFGQTGIEYVAVTKGTGRPDNPGPSIETKHVITDGVARGVEWKYFDGSQVKSGHGQVTCGAPQAFTPRVGDFIIVNGLRSKVVETRQIPATGVPVTYVIIHER